jgi:hypothetical protein
MLPIAAALGSTSPSGVIGGLTVRHAVRTFPWQFSPSLGERPCAIAHTLLRSHSAWPKAILRQLCCATSHSGSFLQLLWPLLTSGPLTATGSPQVMARCSAALPPNLPPRAYQTALLCCASSSLHVGVARIASLAGCLRFAPALCGSCPLARRFDYAALRP